MDKYNVLIHFLERIKNDAVIDSKHIALFVALYGRWMEEGFENTIRVRSRIIMEEAKISSSSTYFEKLKHLHQSGYIMYRPSYSIKEESMIAFYEPG